MLRFLRALFAWLGRKPVVKPTVGVVCHRLNPDDLAALQSMGVRHVRLSKYGSGPDSGEQWIDAAVGAGFDVLCVFYGTAAEHAADVLRWPSVRWQIGNEPAWAAQTPAQAAQMTAGGQVTCGIGHGTPTEWVREFRRLTASQTFAFHVYGFPLSNAVQSTCQSVGPDGWITEIGDTNPAELDKALRLIDGAKYPRAYVYALWSDADGYTLTPAHQAVIRQFIISSGTH